jgi:hypothetical protein
MRAFEMMRAVVARRDLTAVHKAVLFTLVLYRNNETGLCFPSYETIAGGAGIGLSTAKAAVSDLTKRGLLSVTRRSVQGRRESDSNLYTILLPVVQETDHVVQQVDDVVQETDHGGPGNGRQVVQERDGGGPGAGPKLPIELPNGTPNRTEGEALVLTHEPPARSAGRKSRVKTQTQDTRVPSSDASDEEVRLWCERWKIPEPATNPEVVYMIDTFRSSGKAKADWGSTWRTWIRRAPEFARSGGGGRSAPIGVQPPAKPGEYNWRDHLKERKRDG